MSKQQQLIQPSRITVNRHNMTKLTTELTTEQQRIKLQIEAGYGFYGLRYKKATSKEEKDAIIETALGL